MKIGIFALILIIILGCFSCGGKHQRGNKEMNWTEYHTRDSLPSTVLVALDSLTGNTFNIADFDQPYHATDAYLGSALPHRQLSYLGRNGNDWQMTYRHGGVGMNYHFINFNLNRAKSQ